jgi:hypothetical protein
MFLLKPPSCDVQPTAGTRVCAMKNKVGFFLPEPIERAFDEMAEGMVGGKEKWMVITGAILLLLERPAEELGELVRRVRTEGGKDGDFRRLVEQAKARAREKRPARESPPILPPGQVLPPESKRGQQRSQARTRGGKR